MKFAFHPWCAVAAIGLALPASAQTANTTTANVNVLNLLSPVLTLNTTATGQAYLAASLQTAQYDNFLENLLPVPQAVSISDKTIFGAASTAITLANGTTAFYGPGANIAGGLPAQAVQGSGTITPLQQAGGLGGLGTAFQAAVSPAGAAVPSLVTLLTSAYSFASADSNLAKFYFANGTTNGTTAAVAPAGLTLPTGNGYPNTSTSLYDTAYGTSNTAPGQSIYGNSSPALITPSAYKIYDPTALNGATTNPALPSSLTTYAYTDGILIAMLSPQNFKNAILRASEIPNASLAQGVSTPLDLLASRVIAEYDLAQTLNGSSSPYTATNVTSGSTALNLTSQFTTAATALTAYLATQTSGCGGSINACAASNAFGTYSTNTYGQAFALNPGFRITTNEMFELRQYWAVPGGIQTLSLTQAPAELGPVGGGPDGSILLATIYGGSSAQAKALAASVGGALYGNLSTATINQIIANTESPALAAFYGTAMSYWARINFYEAAGYFQNLTGTFTLSSADKFIVQNGGILGGTGTINGAVIIGSGGTLTATGTGSSTFTPLTVNGAVTMQAGSAIQLNGMFLPGTTKLIVTPSTPSIDPSVTVSYATANANLLAYTATKAIADTDPGVSVQVTSNFASLGANTNQRSVAAAIDAAGNAGTYNTAGATFLANLIQNNNAATAPATFTALSGEGLVGQEQAALNASDMFARAVLEQAAIPRNEANGAASSPFFAWASGFGGSGSQSGSVSAGSGGLSTNSSGGAAGFGVKTASGITVGLAAGYSTSDFAVSARATSGHVEGGHAAIYARGDLGPVYISGVSELATFNNTTSRNVLGTGAGAKYDSVEWLGRAEAGYKFALPFANVTPFAGGQIALLMNPAYTESGASTGLNVTDSSVNSYRTFIGAQVDTKQRLGEALVLAPFIRVAWEHEFSPWRQMTASLQALPGYGFTVYGARAASDLARVNLGANLELSQAVAIYGNFDGAFSDAGNFYAGQGGVRIRF